VRLLLDEAARRSARCQWQAIFLIVELSNPYSGLFRLSLEALGK
jgi:hypothetical protein